MKYYLSNVLRRKVLLLFFMQLSVCAAFAQTAYHSSAVKITVDGTSTLHDWKMESSQGQSTATFTLDAAGHLSALTALQFSVNAESLKSEKSGLDKNAYKSLQTNKYKTITYQLTSATVTPAGAVKCLGKMTIAGVTLDADLVATAKVNADKSITVKGSKKLSMKSFRIDPPSFMMGAVKTGNDVTVSFDLTLKN
ncbi:YceI family protein [Chitinophaga tropicalis]|uniref:YceI family protein n=1 Tax=Chitinophaga tropicalis TaxID=2683588 RepID=A0A7K1UD75_9BACT|nr:YceI family protein [Chitinophaga tropicalis]MVT12276.1 YceI family protein [Chitinophaga tropicalis]